MTLSKRATVLFGILESAAVNGARCPQNDQLPDGYGDSLHELCRQGKILLEIMGHNWRVITILDGPNAGKSTSLPPGGRTTPYLIGDISGTRRPSGRSVQARRGPVTLPFKDGHRVR